MIRCLDGIKLKLDPSRTEALVMQRVAALQAGSATARCWCLPPAGV